MPAARLPDGPSVLARVSRTSDLRSATKTRHGSEKRQRRHVARLRLDDEERAELERRASASGLEVGAYLRAAALGSPGVRSRRRAPVDRDLLARSNADLNRVGNNLNQCTHFLHLDLDPPHLLSEVLGELRETLSAIRRAAGHDRQG